MTYFLKTKTLMITAISVAALTGAACSTTTGNVERKAAIGAGIGALAGAVIGNNTGDGDAGTGAAIGAVLGGAGGAYAGYQQDQSRTGPSGQIMYIDQANGRGFYVDKATGSTYWANGAFRS